MVMEMFCLDHSKVNILGMILFYKCCHWEKLDKEYKDVSVLLLTTIHVNLQFS